MKPLLIITHSEEETTQLGKDIAMVLRAGDLLCLSGNLGTGKSVLARGIIRHLAKDDAYEVPSPTYTLCQTYETSPPVSHYDLYRISGMDELEELGWEDALETGCSIIEWPEQCFDELPKEAVHVQFSEDNETVRKLELTGNQTLIHRIERSLLIRQFLEASPFKKTTRSPLMGDASARSYELIQTENEELLLMNAPALPDGPPIKNGKPYSEIAHLAEDVTAFVAIDELIRAKKFCAPKIKAQDLDNGLLLIEHFGSGSIIDETRTPIAERYMVAMEFLAAFHECDFQPEIKLNSGQDYKIPSYDPEAILIEVDLLLQWYAPSQSGQKISEANSKAFEQIWTSYAQRVQAHEQTLVMRDYHSPNILWLAQETGINRIGVIDFQDAVLGPAAYDVASLAQDARVDVSDVLETQLLNHYIKLRKENNPSFDEEEFRASYATMAAQRATKILGIFIRLNERDGKPAYLKHLPRVQEYLQRSLKHPALSDYKNWLETVIKL